MTAAVHFHMLFLDGVLRRASRRLAALPLDEVTVTRLTQTLSPETTGISLIRLCQIEAVYNRLKSIEYKPRGTLLLRNEETSNDGLQGHLNLLISR